MNKISITLIFLVLFVSQVFAGPPPGAGVGEGPGPQPTKKMARWFCFEYGWYGPSLKDLNKTFSGILGGKKIGMNDYIAIGFSLPTPGDDRSGLFLGYWNGGVKQGSNELNLYMFIFSGEGSFRIVKIPDKALFSLGFIVRDVVGFWKFSAGDIDTSEVSIIMDIGPKITAEYYPIKSIGIKLDFGRILWGFDFTDIAIDKIKLQTPGWIIKFGLNLYY